MSKYAPRFEFSRNMLLGKRTLGVAALGLAAIALPSACSAGAASGNAMPAQSTAAAPSLRPSPVMGNNELTMGIVGVVPWTNSYAVGMAARGNAVPVYAPTAAQASGPVVAQIPSFQTAHGRWTNVTVECFNMKTGAVRIEDSGELTSATPPDIDHPLEGTVFLGTAAIQEFVEAYPLYAEFENAAPCG